MKKIQKHGIRLSSGLWEGVYMGEIVSSRRSIDSHIAKSYAFVLTLARSGGGVDATPPWVFLSWTPHRLENRAEIFHSLWGILCATFGEKNLVGSGQVTKLWRHKRNNLRKISAKSWVKATWRGAIDFNGDSWWDWCQYMTGCDPWHCARWESRSTKVTWGHWPRLNSQWQITNRHMFSGVSWGAESESVVHCP